MVVVQDFFKDSFSSSSSKRLRVTIVVTLLLAAWTIGFSAIPAPVAAAQDSPSPSGGGNSPLLRAKGVRAKQKQS